MKISDNVPVFTTQRMLGVRLLSTSLKSLSMPDQGLYEPTREYIVS
ncbi:hypothetical protein [Paenibacillus solani]|nr:hypothetical protein [Paenibacillus solani]